MPRQISFIYMPLLVLPGFSSKQGMSFSEVNTSEQVALTNVLPKFGIDIGSWLVPKTFQTTSILVDYHLKVQKPSA